MNLSNRIFLIGFLGIGAAYVAYLLVRAAQTPVTHDEAFTCIYYRHLPIFNLLTYEYPDILANNHILNTLNVKWWTWVLGLTPVAVRLGNILTSLIYLVSGYFLIRRLWPAIAPRAAAAVIWLANPYLAEFFSLARGYGMAAGLEAAAIFLGWRYLELRSTEERRARAFLLGACVAAAGSVWANLATLNFFLCFIGLLAYQQWFHPQSGSKQAWRILVRISVILFILIYWPMVRIKQAGDFGYFGQQGFWNSTVESFADCWTLGQDYFGPATLPILASGLTLVFALSLLVSIRLWWRSRWQITPDIWLIGLFPATVVVSLLIITATGSSNLTTRVTLFFYPLLMASLLGLFRLAYVRKRVLTVGFMTILALPLAYNFFKNARLNDTYEWRYDRDTYNVLNFIEKTYQAEGRTEPYSLHCFWIFYPSLKYHTEYTRSRYTRVVNDLQKEPMNLPYEVNPQIDFYYMISDHYYMYADYYDVVYKSETNDRFLLRRRPVVPAQ